MSEHLADENAETALLEQTAKDGTPVQVHPLGNGRHNIHEWLAAHIVPLTAEEEES